MPFIVTTINDPAAGLGDPTPGSVSRLAVATLEEARDEANRIVQRQAPPWSTDGLRFARECSASGGTVGPLPDGTTITVEPADGEPSSPLWVDPKWFKVYPPQTWQDNCDAFNAKQASDGR